MPRPRLMSAKAKPVVLRCCEQGLSSHQTVLRLAMAGVTVAERTAYRWLAKCRAEQEAEQRRARDLEYIGRGLGSVQIGATGAADVLRTSLPDWRDKQSSVLRELLQQFLVHPTGELYSGLAVGMFGFLLSANLSEAVEKSRA